MSSISLSEFKKLKDLDVQLLDSRPTNDFSSGYISNSINVSINGSFEYMSNCIFDKEKDLVIISTLERGSEAFLRLEKEDFKSIHLFDFKLWYKANQKLHYLDRLFAKDASSYVSHMKDVSNAEDWEVLHVKDVISTPLIDIVQNPNIVSKGDVLYCGNGHKSLAAVSFLKKEGVSTIDIVGGLSAMLVDAPDLEI